MRRSRLTSLGAGGAIALSAQNATLLPIAFLGTTTVALPVGICMIGIVLLLRIF